MRYYPPSPSVRSSSNGINHVVHLCCTINAAVRTRNILPISKQPAMLQTADVVNVATAVTGQFFPLESPKKRYETQAKAT